MYAFKNLHLGKVCLFDVRCSSLVVVVLVEGGVWCVVGGGAWWCVVVVGGGDPHLHYGNEEGPTL